MIKIVKYGVAISCAAAAGVAEPGNFKDVSEQQASSSKQYKEGAFDACKGK